MNQGMELANVYAVNVIAVELFTSIHFAKNVHRQMTLTTVGVSKEMTITQQNMTMVNVDAANTTVRRKDNSLSQGKVVASLPRENIFFKFFHEN